MKTKTIALIFFILHLAILLFICATWYKLNKNMSEFGGEMADGMFVIILVIISIYYFGMTIWAYIVYKKTQRTFIQLSSVFVFGILTIGIILYKLYF